ncbi:hypothetical protein ADUPG1_005488, partial [Aduncisulcus paluster]
MEHAARRIIAGL